MVEVTNFPKVKLVHNYLAFNSENLTIKILILKDH